MSTIYQYLLNTLKKTDTKEDLQWFANVYGTHSKLDVPVYEVQNPRFVWGFFCNLFLISSPSISALFLSMPPFFFHLASVHSPYFFLQSIVPAFLRSFHFCSFSFFALSHELHPSTYSSSYIFFSFHLSLLSFFRPSFFHFLPSILPSINYFHDHAQWTSLLKFSSETIANILVGKSMMLRLVNQQSLNSID